MIYITFHILSSTSQRAFTHNLQGEVTTNKFRLEPFICLFAMKRQLVKKLVHSPPSQIVAGFRTHEWTRTRTPTYTQAHMVFPMRQPDTAEKDQLHRRQMQASFLGLIKEGSEKG